GLGVGAGALVVTPGGASLLLQASSSESPRTIEQNAGARMSAEELSASVRENPSCSRAFREWRRLSPGTGSRDAPEHERAEPECTWSGFSLGGAAPQRDPGALRRGTTRDRAGGARVFQKRDPASRCGDRVEKSRADSGAPAARRRGRPLD